MMHSEVITNVWLMARMFGKVALGTGIGLGIALAVVAENTKAQTYIYRWARYLGMPVLGGSRKGQPCKVLTRGGRNSCLIEFPDGFKAVTSRNALRKVQ